MPDQSTISRFRSTPPVRGLGEQLLSKVARQLGTVGFLVKAGVIMDAKLVAA